ncbi:hypothetical protein CSUB01_10206 [Colletotrichum sublineola]|uniref:Uncharacterized protein n=1 Tax=Colletotrichum sublineola TaxID=1173701 RepID=A0A066XYA0_COLSU|nr:hypothetical protein CSUB01_10206 [Colletotrichum sublineola]
MTSDHNQSWVFRLANRLPGFRKRHEMVESDFKPNNTITHRYADAEVLKKVLVDLGFEEKGIKLKATKVKGFEMQLKRELEPSNERAI